MSKAILILDEMPNECMKCPLRFKDGDTDDWFRFRCHMSTDQIPKEGKLNNCLLKPLPQKKDPFEEHMKVERNERYISESLINQIRGYNFCIDEILGVEE